MLTKAERRDKALQHFVSTFGEHIGTQKWEEYCQKSDLLEPKEKKTPKPKAVKGEK